MSARKGSGGSRHSRIVAESRHEDGMAGGPGERLLQLRLEPIEVPQAVPGGLVAQVVGQAGEAVDRQKMAARRSGQEPRRHREVLPIGLAHEVGGAESSGGRIDRRL